MSIKILTSCTKSKRFGDLPGALTLADFQRCSETELRAREDTLSRYRIPAGFMYTGRSYTHTMLGAEEVRETHGPDALSVDILSAGYGLISEQRPIVPYEATLNDLSAAEISEWAKRHRISLAVRDAIRDADLVLISLPAKYLAAVGPLIPRPFQRIIYFGAPANAEAPGVTILPTGQQQAKALSAGMIELKGYMVRALCQRIAHDTPFWRNIMVDTDKDVLMAAITQEIRGAGRRTV